MVCLLAPYLHCLTTLDPDPSDFTLVLPRNDSQASWGCIPPCSRMWSESNTVFMWPLLMAEDKEAPLVYGFPCLPLLEGNFLSSGIACVREVTGCHQVCVQGLSVTFFFFKENPGSFSLFLYYFCHYLKFIYCRPHCGACRILVPRPGMEPMLSAE